MAISASELIGAPFGDSITCCAGRPQNWCHENPMLFTMSNRSRFAPGLLSVPVFLVVWRVDRVEIDPWSGRALIVRLKPDLPCVPLRLTGKEERANVQNELGEEIESSKCEIRRAGRNGKSLKRNRAGGRSPQCWDQGAGRSFRDSNCVFFWHYRNVAAVEPCPFGLSKGDPDSVSRTSKQDFGIIRIFRVPRPRPRASHQVWASC
jgi:hypothetical protein